VVKSLLRMKKITFSIGACFVLLFVFVFFARSALAAPSVDAVFSPPTLDVLEMREALKEQVLGAAYASPVKYAIRNAIYSGVSIETIVLLLLLPVVTTFIAGARHLVGLRGFGIFFPAALGVVFAAIGPVVGIALFLLIVLISTIVRIGLRKIKAKLAYLPRMSLILWLVSLSVLVVLFASPYVSGLDFANISIFPLLIMVLLVEEFTRVQLGKNVEFAASLTFETLILAVLAFVILSYKPLQLFALLHPELVLVTALLFDLFLGRYMGLRLLEMWRFRTLLRK